MAKLYVTSSYDEGLLGEELAKAQRQLPDCRFVLYTDGGGKGPCVLILRENEPVLAEVHASTIVDALRDAVQEALTK